MKLKIVALAALLTIIFSACSRSPKGDCTVDALTQIASEYGASGKYEQALQVAQTIDNSAYKTRIFMQIAVNYLPIGKKDRATEVLSQAVDE